MAPGRCGLSSSGPAWVNTSRAPAARSSSARKAQILGAGVIHLGLLQKVTVSQPAAHRSLMAAFSQRVGVSCANQRRSQIGTVASWPVAQAESPRQPAPIGGEAPKLSAQAAITRARPPWAWSLARRQTRAHLPKGCDDGGPAPAPAGAAKRQQAVGRGHRTWPAGRANRSADQRPKCSKQRRPPHIDTTAIHRPTSWK